MFGSGMFYKKRLHFSHRSMAVKRAIKMLQKSRASIKRRRSKRSLNGDTHSSLALQAATGHSANADVADPDIINECQPCHGDDQHLNVAVCVERQDNTARVSGDGCMGSSQSVNESQNADTHNQTNENDQHDDTVYLQHDSHQERNLVRFNGIMYVDHFRFVNLDRIHSFVDALNAVHTAIQSLLDRVISNSRPGDFIQLRLDSHDFNSVFSTKQASADFNVETFLDNIANALQSNAECLAGGTLKLVVIIIRNRHGGMKKRLRSIAYSQIIKGKRQWLYDFNNYNTKMCFAASVYALLCSGKVPDSNVLANARKLHASLGISEDEGVCFSDIAKFENYLKIGIKVLYFNQGDWQFYQTGTDFKEKSVYVLHHENHYYGIKNIKGFIGAAYFCEKCCSIYHHKNGHSCAYLCKACRRENCEDLPDRQPRCPNCRVFCRSNQCLEIHRHLATSDRLFCTEKVFCDECLRFVKNSVEHKCSGLSCSVCSAKVKKYDTHICYMQEHTPPETTDKYIFYDFECMQETGIHTPNYIYATSLNAESDWEFCGISCVQQFIRVFTTSEFEGYTFIAHNAGRYDSYFIVQELIREKLRLDLINQGGKLLCVTVKDLDIRFIDSLNFLPMKLSKLPAAMGFSDSKGHFPHFFNTEQNQGYLGPIPSVDYYGVDYMMSDEKKEFMTWYEAHKHDHFDFQKELKSYCRQDVNVLRRACVRYRNRILKMTQKSVLVFCKNLGEYVETKKGIDPFQLVTLASVCMAMFRYNFHPKDTIAILPGDNYHKTQKRFSTPAIQWLMYVSHTENIAIQHALRGGEKKVGLYYLDGYACVDGKNIAFEFQGCFYHGCPVCYKETDSNEVTNTTYGQLYYTSVVKQRYLQACGFTIRLMWEHEWQAMIKTDVQLQEYLKNMQFPEPLDPRDALYGGRTNAIKLYHKAEPGETINYYDFTSLYPFVNKTKKYPVGHPKIIFENFGFIKKYFGIAKLKVYPPRDLFFPVLPVKLNKKLMFPLCYTCALNSQSETCTHTDEERSLSGTWCTIEIEMAVEKGYRIAQIYEVWDFSNTSETLFAPYINLHLRDKQEASGYPSWCVDEEKKKQYIDAFYEKEGIRLRPSEIKVNPAKRQISKLFLNSLWGKFGQRSNLPRTSIITNPDELFKLAFVPHYELSEVNIIDEETATANWKYTKDRYTVNKNTNIFIACFTTAYARLELYSLLDNLQERCLYHDTDSVIFTSREGEWQPSLGDYLGELTNEIPNGSHITEFVSAGPKTYGYKLNNGKTTLKVKGITLNTLNIQTINFESLKDLVLDYPLNSEPQLQKTLGIAQQGIVRNRKYWQIETRTLRKTQKCVYTKRLLTHNFTTLPFGY